MNIETNTKSSQIVQPEEQASLDFKVGNGTDLFSFRDYFMYYVYILYSENFDRYYIGQTDNIEARINRHNEGKVKPTKPYILWDLKYTEKFETRSDAMKRERFIKNQRNKEFYRKLIASSIGPEYSGSTRD